MSEADITWVLFGSLVATLLLGIPVGYALGISTVFGLLLTPIPLVYISQTFYTGVGLFPLIAIPGFILAGLLMEHSGLTDRIIRIINISVGNVSGGLAVVTIVSCMFFASLTGSGPATTAAIGGIMVPAMIRAGYPVSFAAAVAATGGTLGILIPPSNPMIIYGVVANVSVRGTVSVRCSPRTAVGRRLGNVLSWDWARARLPGDRHSVPVHRILGRRLAGQGRPADAGHSPWLYIRGIRDSNGSIRVGGHLFGGVWLGDQEARIADAKRLDGSGGPIDRSRPDHHGTGHRFRKAAHFVRDTQ